MLPQDSFPDILSNGQLGDANGDGCSPRFESEPASKSMYPNPGDNAKQISLVAMQRI